MLLIIYMINKIKKSKLDNVNCITYTTNSIINGVEKDVDNIIFYNDNKEIINNDYLTELYNIKYVYPKIINDIIFPKYDLTPLCKLICEWIEPNKINIIDYRLQIEGGVVRT